MKLEDAEQAILIYENEGINKAEEFLVNSISPEWVEKHVFWLEHIGGFQSRYILAKKSLEDYKAERYYASILVNLTLIDGWVNELNIINNHRKGFFADDSNLSAWDSITAHNKGLQALKELFSIPRMKTHTEEITIPYRHGIMHGMDLGYDNKIVAAKCWLALFAVREWAIKANKDELLEPKIEIKQDISWRELIYQIKKSQENINSYNNWKPRDINIPRDFPEAGKPNDYPEGTPEKVLINFFFILENQELWVYGAMLFKIARYETCRC